ncbi:DUF5691 domain-containing protein [Rhodococcus sp. Z13]|uniref:DUF5691 domain-containing protein n=1 Tax=Rhodococcus sacchari TaxID=2962047 RepID=A0ACD4DBM3_9NOCA|nr:DUF5691 domain-containing protein [Rhodococcus sp. Z13]UYP17424.1 DUF5691 domain-containing protein [Rhodococcus sp. Z13]
MTVPEDLVTAALLGTARTTPDLRALHTSAAADGLLGDAATRLLSAAALESAFLTSATVPVVRERPVPAPEDDRPVLPDAAAERLRALLTVRSPLLDEWFDAAAGFRADHRIVVDLLDAAAADPVHRDRLVRLTGARGRWLAARNRAWTDLLPPDPDDETPWRDGPPAGRRRWFEAVRAQRPEHAADLLAVAWSSHTAAQRAELLELLTDGLGPHDEALLERALDDRSRKVRAVALDLLSRLPGSAFAHRMAERVEAWIRLDGFAPVVAVPEALDASALRDGLGEPAPRGTDPRTFRAVTLISAAPLQVWDRYRDGTSLPRFDPDDPLCAALLDGWSTATVRQRNSEWATALLHRCGSVGQDLAQVLPREVVLDRLRAARRTSLLDRVRGVQRPEVLDEALLAALPAPWPRDVAEKVLTALYSDPESTRLVHEVLALLAHRAPFELADLLADAANRTDDLGRVHLFASAADTLILRRTIHEELS